MLEERSLKNNDFTEILSIISKAQTRALASVNREMITMYWKIGRIVSEKTASDGWGKSRRMPALLEKIKKLRKGSLIIC